MPERSSVLMVRSVRASNEEREAEAERQDDRKAARAGAIDVGDGVAPDGGAPVSAGVPPADDAPCQAQQHDEAADKTDQDSSR